VTADGEHLPNPRYQNPAEFLIERVPPTPDPLEATPPVIELTDPAAAAARGAIRVTGHATLLDPAEIDDLVMAVSEAVTNALRHGRPPVLLRVWTARDRIVAIVRDHGPGVEDPFAGLLPATATSAGGMGLWVIHHSCRLVTLDRDQEGFTIRLVAGTPATETERHARYHA
jgi:anti-sigma regulatory factor (Ser/Thr protein kinase)